MILLIDKPSGYTSFDIIRKLQKLYPKTKIWHWGTLDPMATGLLVIAIWKDTKKLTQIIWSDKEYITTIDFSVETDTWDYDYHEKFIKYEVIEKNWKKWILKNWQFIPAPSLKDIKEKLNKIIWTVKLPLPAFSAKKLKWKRLYELAREWKELNLEKEMKINSYEILDYNFPYLKLKLNVWKWTYIRSIWYWLGKQFNLWWALKELRRIKIGNFLIKEK